MSFLSRVINHDMNNISPLPSHVYVDVDITNNSTLENSKPVPLQFTESRNSNIIEDSSLYYLSIIRFHIDTVNSIPVWMPLIQINNSDNDPNKTIYSFTMKYKTYTYQQYLQYIPQDKSIAVPPDASTQENFDYYSVRSYCWVVDLLNNTLNACYAGLSALVTAGSDTLPSSNVPFLYYDPSSSSLSLYADVAGYNSSLENPIYLFANTALFNMLSGFEYISNGYNAPNGTNYQFSIRSSGANWNVLEFDTYNAVGLFEEYPCISTWSPCRSIVFTSPNLPIVPTIVSTPDNFGSATSMSQVSNNDKQNIITDMEVGLTTGKEWLPSVDYSPFVYRLIPMTNRNPISQIQISIFWKDIYGGMHMMMMPSGCNASIKILFVKKSFYSNIS